MCTFTRVFNYVFTYVQAHISTCDLTYILINVQTYTYNLIQSKYVPLCMPFMCACEHPHMSLIYTRIRMLMRFHTQETKRADIVYVTKAQ